MPAQSLQTDAFILLKRPPAEAFQTFTVLSAEHGVLHVLQRVAKKSAANAPALDLFDEAALLLESSSQGRTWFVKEARLLARRAGIGRSYEALRHASAFAALIARNPVHEDGRAAVSSLVRAAFDAFDGAAPPEIVFFKSLYRFARDEGYAVKQEWLPALPRELRAEAGHLLGTPLAPLKPADAGNPKLKVLIRRLEEYLRGHTEILLD